MLSIIIVNYNQREFLSQCLKNIAEANIQLNYEVIVVDNASTDGSQKLLDEIKHQTSPPKVFDREAQTESAQTRGAGPPLAEKIKIIFNDRNFGFAKAVNQGIVASRGEYILILNPDVIVLPKAVENLYQFMEEHPQCAISGPQLLNPNKTIQYSCCHFQRWCTPILRRTILGKLPWGKKYLRYYLMTDWDHKSTREVDWLLGGALMVRREAIEKVGLMDERFFLYYEDIDWCRRFHQAGCQVFYVPNAQMYHFHQRFSAERDVFPALFSKITWIHIASAIKYFIKWSK